LVHFLNVRRLIGPLTVGPVKTVVLPSTLDSVHVLAKDPSVFCSVVTGIENALQVAECQPEPI
jgi:hypothetical protein